MTLTTHAIVGAALASVVPSHPVAAFALGFGSHFLLDAIPHWDYHLDSLSEDKKNPMATDMKLGKSFLFDLCKIGADFLLGFVLVFLFFTTPHNISYSIIFGAFGAILPDALQFFYFKWRHEPLVALQKFHLWVHSKKDFKDKPFIGVSFQIIFIAFVIFLQKIFVH